MTIQEVLNGAFKKLSVLGTGETLTAEMSQDARASLNLMLRSWSIRNVSVIVTVGETFPLVGNTGLYTIGPTGNFNTVRPTRILNASIKDANNLFTPVKIITEDFFLSFGDRDFSAGLPDRLWYEPAIPLGRIHLYVKPMNSSYQLEIRSQKPFLAVVALDDDLEIDYDFAPAYDEAIVYNLAVRIAPDYGLTPKMEVLGMATELFDRLVTYVTPTMEVSLDLALSRVRNTSIFNVQN
jgi:hypothetical protein